MNSFRTNLSKHCFYGNIVNILNYYGVKISEAELVILSDALNCNVELKNGLFFGVSNHLCERGLGEIGYRLCPAENEKTIHNLLEERIPILLLINSGVLTYHTIFKGTDRRHYIVLLNEHNDKYEISDSFVPTIPMSVFQGEVPTKLISQQIMNNQAAGFLLGLASHKSRQADFKSLLIKYIKNNALSQDFSMIWNLKKYCKLVLDNIDDLSNQSSLRNLSYEIKVAGAIARFDYLMELFRQYLNIEGSDYEILLSLRSRWELIANKLMKCSITQKKEYFKKIYEDEIPSLINKEWILYQGIYKRGDI